MLVEDSMTMQETERARLAVNQEVVRLLQEKTVPLNRGRYMHLQKISRAICKDTPNYISSTQLTHNIQTSSLLSPPRHPTTSVRTRPMAAANLLLQQLTGIKRLQSESQLMANKDYMINFWQLSRHKTVQSEQLSQDKRGPPAKTPKSQGRRKQENLLELAQRAEKYLRVKKRDLWQRYHKDNHSKKGSRQMEAQCIPSINTLKKGKRSNKMLQRELLRDIRQSMLQQNLNRMKREINHRKIVQMR